MKKLILSLFVRALIDEVTTLLWRLRAGRRVPPTLRSPEPARRSKLTIIPPSP